MDFEKLGSFYLGKQYDTTERRLLDRLVMYDARDLTTHAVCVGMTGSGKTGLCIDLLEEAAIDQVPAIIIDPKGDMANLLLAFPGLRGADFRPWINIDDARRKGMSPDEFAEKQASLWREGLSSWGQSPERISLLKDSIEQVVFTPGSSAGVPVSILSSFAPPALDWATHSEELREKIQGIVAGLLGLIGVEADPVRSREYILISSLFEHFWKSKIELDLAGLIMAIQNPPITKLGVFDLDTFFPPGERFELAMSLNSILASPAFQEWTEGHPLDAGGFLVSPSGKPRHSIFYIAHLSDSERMFFVTILLNEVLSWIRTQPGTTSLRAILYMDEIFGYFPPVANPPSKKPMLSLLKQARAFGLGVVLATQNPVDLDYKGLTNTGTWFIGRLQTERDKLRVLDGLEGIGGEDARGPGREEVDRVLSRLESRVFLMHNVHEGQPVIFQTRWAMSYLRGPLTKAQIREIQNQLEIPEQASRQPVSIAPPSGDQGIPGIPPVLPPGFEAVFLPIRRSAASVQARSRSVGTVRRERLVYSPGLVGLAKVHFVDRKAEVDETRHVARLVEVPRDSEFVRWADSIAIDLDFAELTRQPESRAAFYELPDSIDEISEIKSLERDFADFLYHSEEVTLFYNPATDLTSRPRETESDFRSRIGIKAREQRDAEVDVLNSRYQKQLERLQGQLDKAELAHSKKKAAADARRTETLVSIGESLLGMFLGRRTTRAASSGLSKIRMSSSAKMAAEEASQKVDSVKTEMSSLEEELRQQADGIIEKWDQSLAVLETRTVKPRRTDVKVELVGIAWIPYWEFEHSEGGSGRKKTIPAALS